MTEATSARTPDGVNNAADIGQAGESAYPNPHTGKKPQGFEGGQSGGLDGAKPERDETAGKVTTP